MAHEEAIQRAMGLEPTTASLEGCTPRDATIADKALTEGSVAACTSACTSNAENLHAATADAQAGGHAEGIAQGDGKTGGQGAATPLEALAQAIANLSADDRARLAAMLGNPAVRPDPDGQAAQGDGGPALSAAEGKGKNP